jgi:hypothetical protein
MLALVSVAVALTAVPAGLQAQDREGRSGSMMGRGMMGGDHMMERMDRMMEQCSAMMRDRGDRPNDRQRRRSPDLPDRDR